MVSRTLEGKHTKRFIIEVKAERTWFRSLNPGLQGFFPTREEANAALTEDSKSIGCTYRVRQK